MIFAEPDRTSPGSVFAPWLDRPEIAQLVRELPDHHGELARAIGADAYCRDAAVAVETAKKFMARKHNQVAAG